MRKVFREKITGTTADRPQLAAAMRQLAPSAVLEIEGAAEPDVRGYAWKQLLRLSVREGSYRWQVRAGEVKVNCCWT
jgi:hypothetical protein